MGKSVADGWEVGRMGRVFDPTKPGIWRGGVVGGVAATTTSTMGAKLREEAGNAPTRRGEVVWVSEVRS